ncbi:MAG TPA: TetR/AcrR family transcriptional regulator [Terriglobales bacterium]|jgi:AcrR family transcriptional regulator|nr:TetR/AcrR family transcriptional regulator [Terriglobales bacterium]
MLSGVNSNHLASQPHHPSRDKSFLPPSRRKRDRAGKQKALIQAALRLFATKGYEATTTREIAAAAGCAEGLIHRYFKGKAGLLPALVECRISEELTELRHLPRSAVGLEEEFIQLVDWEIDYLWKNRDFLRVFISRALVDPTLASVMNQAVLSSRIKVVIERLKRHRQCASLPKSDLELLAQSVGMFGLVFGFMRPMVLGQNPAVARKTAAVLAGTLVRGLHYAQTD